MRKSVWIFPISEHNIYGFGHKSRSVPSEVGSGRRNIYAATLGQIIQLSAIIGASV